MYNKQLKDLEKISVRLKLKKKYKLFWMLAVWGMSYAMLERFIRWKEPTLDEQVLLCETHFQMLDKRYQGYYNSDMDYAIHLMKKANPDILNILKQRIAVDSFGNVGNYLDWPLLINHLMKNTTEVKGHYFKNFVND